VWALTALLRGAGKSRSSTACPTQQLHSDDLTRFLAELKKGIAPRNERGEPRLDMDCKGLFRDSVAVAGQEAQVAEERHGRLLHLVVERPIVESSAGEVRTQRGDRWTWISSTTSPRLSRSGGYISPSSFSVCHPRSNARGVDASGGHGLADEPYGRSSGPAPPHLGQANQGTV
jgi:hypothetical protein